VKLNTSYINTKWVESAVLLNQSIKLFTLWLLQASNLVFWGACHQYEYARSKSRYLKPDMNCSLLMFLSLGSGAGPFHVGADDTAMIRWWLWW